MRCGGPAPGRPGDRLPTVARPPSVRRLAPGDTLTLVDHRGAGTVRRWWLTVAPRNNVAIQRQLIVRCYRDDEPTPSVEVPVSDFFGVDFGEWRQYVSAPRSMTSGGYTSYWPMPFRRRARITVENRARVPAEAFYYNVDVETRDRPPADSARSTPSSAARPRCAAPPSWRSTPRSAGTTRAPCYRCSRGAGAGSGSWRATSACFTRAPDYGDVRVLVDGVPRPPVVRGYAPAVGATGPVSFGRVTLAAGANELAVELVGKDPRSRGYGDGYLVGVDGFALRP